MKQKRTNKRSKTKSRLEILHEEIAGMKSLSEGIKTVIKDLAEVAYLAGVDDEAERWEKHLELRG